MSVYGRFAKKHSLIISSVSKPWMSYGLTAMGIFKKLPKNKITVKNMILILVFYKKWKKTTYQTTFLSL